jgi:hypothetical protein
MPWRDHVKVFGIADLAEMQALYSIDFAADAIDYAEAAVLEAAQARAIADAKAGSQPPAGS